VLPAPGFCVSPISRSLLSGSSDPLRHSTCPSFQTQFINPVNLTQYFPFFASVGDVATFDFAFSNYLSSPAGFAFDKYVAELGCTNVDPSFQLQYERTVL
jgi:hypothetical protein